MTEILTMRQDALPDDMRILLRDYPRDAWPDHPNFATSIQKWMGAHATFKTLGEILGDNTELYLDKARDADAYAARLAHFGNMLVRNLHGHHSWEDRRFFPELSAADNRFDTGLDTLESDHEALDQLLDKFTRQANRIVQLVQMEPAQARNEAGPLLETIGTLRGFLDRHLNDEEDLVVPILLHHKMRG